ncbi:MAG: hypothetical protein QG641_1647 [Candidatus Poribacteria bacterium]|nr:hypothetical protein [Candidatus Poribacteria bacterium]
MNKMILRVSLLSVLLICFLTFASFAGSPPNDVKLASKAFANVADNSWTTLDFSSQPAGEYYLEMTDLTGSNIGCWGAKTDKYADGNAYQDGQSIDGDLRMQYTPKGESAVELVVIAPQGAIGDDWNPFGLQDAKVSIGQSFKAPKEFVAVAFQTPTWNTANSGCTLTLYSAAKTSAVKSVGKLAYSWGSIKSQN